jgi:hypothetical protein
MESPPMTAARTAQALDLMQRFAERTGLTSDRAPERYLWTDAFAVCNFLGLGETESALRLVNQVHHTLGQHRADDGRHGWISGLDAQEGEVHPTRGGLRIGKKLPERAPDEPFDERVEWDRDGQYFHYLTKWMHALDQVARTTRQPMYRLWARELAATAHRAFTYGRPEDCAPGRRRMYWKMSIDLSRPLVPSMGQHDPLDGYITCVQLDGGLARQTADFAAMIGPDLATTDPLGLGGLLTDAWRVEQLMRAGAFPSGEMLERLLRAALVGLMEYVRRGELGAPATHRLAFRELGLAIGLAAAASMHERGGNAWVDQLARFVPLRDEIESFWLHPEHRRTAAWLEHANINDVMLATSLAPAGYTTLRS